MSFICSKRLALIVGLGTIIFALYPSLTSAQTEFQGINRASDCPAFIESFSKIDKPYYFDHVLSHPNENFRGSTIGFSSSPFAISKKVFIDNVSHSSGTRMDDTAYVDGRGFATNNSISKRYPSPSDTYVATNSKSKDTECQPPILFFSEFQHVFGTQEVDTEPIVFHEFSPSVSDGRDLLFSSDFVTDWILGKGCTQVVSGIPCFHEVSQPQTLITSGTRPSENKLFAKCGNLTVSIRWRSPIGITSPTVSSYDEFSVYQLEHDDGAGTDLGMCQATDEQSQQEIGHPFHLAVKSGGSSIASFDNGFACEGCLPIIISPKGNRLAIAQVQATPPKTTHDQLVLLPSRE